MLRGFARLILGARHQEGVLMGLWKEARDRIVAGRLIDEEIHAFAYKEIDSGVRRDGLWAKALIQGGSDPNRTKLAYLNLLVRHLKDEHYVDSRDAETWADAQRAQDATYAFEERVRREAQTQEDATERARIDEEAAHQEHLQGLCSLLRERGLSFYQYQQLAQAVGASLGLRTGFLSTKYIVNYRQRENEFGSVKALRPWFEKNIAPLIGNDA